MKSRIFSVSAALILTIFSAGACGACYPIIPTPEFFAADCPGTAELHKQENLRLWQQLTSPDIPLAHIEEAVYNTDRGHLYATDAGDIRTDNKFLNYIRNCDREIYDFLDLAIGVWEKRQEQSSPWYYPSSPYEADNSDFSYFIERCKEYSGSRLRDRYALQTVRCLFASRQYAACAEYFDKAFAEFDDSNLFKRMASGYAAGCWSRLGDTARANRCFAANDDFASIRDTDAVAYMAACNPDSPSLMRHIRSLAGDSAKFCAIEPVARSVVSTRRAHYEGDWLFTLAYATRKFHGDLPAARRYIARALRSSFSSDSFRDHARAYAFLLAGEAGDTSGLLTELKWFETKIDMTSSDAEEWERILKNCVYTGYVPSLWEHGDYTTAILLCGYTDNYFPAHMLHGVTLEQMRTDPAIFNCQDYSTLTFRLMESLSSEKLADVKRKSAACSPLYTFLRRYARTDSDYFDELIGTLAMREENYSRACRFLVRVSPDYERNLNIYRHLGGKPGSKLEFARRMLAIQTTMNGDADADTRGLAHLMYSIGLRETLNRWALLQYRSGQPDHVFEPAFYYDSESACHRLGFLYDSEDYDTYIAAVARCNSEESSALAMLTTDEARARAQLLLGNVLTVIRLYPATAAADVVRRSCDNWRDWL